MIRTTDFYTEQYPNSTLAEGAQLLAARAHADTSGWYFSWSDDTNGDHSYLDQTDESGALLFEDTTIETCEMVLLHTEGGTVLASLGCIDNATQDYRDLIEAELALEALADDSTCGECGATWNSILTPTPAARCPFEEGHESVGEGAECSGYEISGQITLAGVQTSFNVTADGYQQWSGTTEQLGARVDLLQAIAALLAR